MIQLYVKEFLIIKGYVPKPNTLIKMGINQFMAAKLIKNKVKNLSLKTLTVLCAHLDCTPNELLNYKPDGLAISTNSALHRIAKQPHTVSPIDYVKALKPEEIAKAVDFLKNIVNKGNDEEK